LKNISSDPSPEPKKPRSGTAPKKQFLVIEIPADKNDHAYPKAVFACDTVDEALSLCKQMNKDAGYERYGVQKPASGHKD
jgi:hypothetical protein